MPKKLRKHKAEAPRTGTLNGTGTIEVECGDQRVPPERASSRWGGVTCVRCLWRKKGR